MKLVIRSLTAVACCFALHAPAQDVRIPSTPDQGLNTGDDPIAFFARGGIPCEQVLPDGVDVYGRVKPPPGMGAHVLTGPVYVEGAEPGDMLEVRMIDVKFRVPYGVNATNKGAGELLHRRRACRTRRW